MNCIQLRLQEHTLPEGTPQDYPQQSIQAQFFLESGFCKVAAFSSPYIWQNCQLNLYK
ncbi:hypothetical protein NIES267_42520 [Calothrix parasitica NIES-267]|uniref:Uncharacterized protein n=1 Tax=Calothrix parasitica NIES-267 TaxID=1973488 RepID=A0A1Z4LU34_9CYAN|nr:hypothetical protein NIES267_42520 [Calothrix parasitica NIES-267]